MTALRHFALGCCTVSAAAGLIRLLWPENGFKPVINTVLALYIIAAGLQALRGAFAADWPDLLPGSYDGAAADGGAYAEYADELALSVSADAVQEVLRRSGIDAAVTLRDGVCEVRLTHPSDAPAAEALLQENCGTLPWTLSGGEAP